MTDPLSPYLDAGWHLIPLHRHDKVDKAGRQKGKAPLHDNWTKRDYDQDRVLSHFEGGGNAGVRFADGQFVIDVDIRNILPGEDPVGALEFDCGFDCADYPRVRTGSGGLHVYMRCPEGLKLRNSLAEYTGLEFKAHPKQVVSAGSLHPDNAQPYEWLPGPSLAKCPDAPRELLDLIIRKSGSSEQESGCLSTLELRELLRQLPVKDYQEHDAWLEIMMAAHHATGSEGREEFVAWSTSDPDYGDAGEQIRNRWDSLRTDREGGITVATLMKAAKDHGEQGTTAITAFQDDEPPEAAEGPEGPLTALNRKYATVLIGGKFRIITERDDPVLERSYLTFLAKPDFEGQLSNLLMPTEDARGNLKFVPLATEWLRWSGRKQYEGIVFDPQKEHEGYWNLWKGWGIEPREGDWSYLRGLVEDHLLEGNPTHIDYVWDWCAHMIQRPWELPEVALCFRGDKGTGKGTLGRALLRLAGRHGMQTANAELLVGRFNHHLRDLKFLFADEAFYAGDKKHESVLKAMITEPVLAYERKNVDPEPGRNFLSMFMASNSEWMVPASIDERRFALFTVGNTAKGDYGFWARLNAQLNGEGLPAFLHFLLERKLPSAWHPRQSVPRPAALIEQMVASDDFLGFWLHCLKNGYVADMQRGNWHEGDIAVPKSVFKEAADEHWGWKAARNRANETMLGKALTRVLPEGYPKSAYKQVKPEEPLPRDGQGRARFYELPSLAVCRQSLEDALDCEVDWED